LIAVVRAIRELAVRVDQIRFERVRSRRYDAACIERIRGADFWVPVGVHNPALFRTGPLLARTLERRVRPEDRVLDMGSGSGIVGVLAARAGASVVAIDQNPDAVSATRINAMLNKVELVAAVGDLYQPLSPTERFRFLAFNPPFFEGVGDLALHGGPGLDVLDRFLAGAQPRLAPGGEILIAGSTAGALGTMRALYRRHGFLHRTVAFRERIAERLVIDRLVPS
jgi:methylase of polypeptide subunit release factors